MKVLLTECPSCHHSAHLGLCTHLSGGTAYHCCCSRTTINDQEMWCSRCHKMNPCRYAPSPDAGPYWRCSECGEIIGQNDD